MALFQIKDNHNVIKEFWSLKEPDSDFYQDVTS